LKFDNSVVTVIKGTYSGKFCISSMSNKFGIDVEFKIRSSIFKTIPETIKGT